MCEGAGSIAGKAPIKVFEMLLNAPYGRAVAYASRHSGAGIGV